MEKDHRRWVQYILTQPCRQIRRGLHNVYGCCCRVGTFPLGKFFNINEILFRDALSKRNKLSSFVGASVKGIGAIEVDYLLWSFAFDPLEFL